MVHPCSKMGYVLHLGDLFLEETSHFHDSMNKCFFYPLL